MTCVCGCGDRLFRREASWLAVVCGWCGTELSGVDVERLVHV